MPGISAQPKLQAVPEETPPHRRRNMLQVISGASRDFWGKVTIAILFLLPLVAGFASYMLYASMSKLSGLKVEDAEALTNIVHELRSVGFLFLSVVLMLCLLGVYFLFFLSVRVYGPQVALVRFIDQLKAGDYSAYRSLRRDDQLKEIWRALQELATVLKRKHD